MPDIKFVVAGAPKGKGRPKFSIARGRTNVYTPDETVVYENLIQTECKIQCGNKRFNDKDEIRMDVRAFYEIPKSKAKGVKLSMRLGKIRPTKKPDADNVIKVIADSLNKIAYKDDAQIVEILFAKYYSDTPRIEVILHDARNEQPS